MLDGNVMYHWAAGDTQWRYYSVLPGSSLPGIQVERHRRNRWYNAAGGLWCSLDSGLTWEEVYTNGIDTSVYDFWLNPYDQDEIILGDRDGNRVMVSDDGGDTWSQLGTVPTFDGYFGGITGAYLDLDFDTLTPQVIADLIKVAGSLLFYLFRLLLSIDNGTVHAHALNPENIERWPG